MIEYLGKTVEVQIDRPVGYVHPEYGLYYPVNYGYIPNTISGDEESIDVYVLGEFQPIKNYTGKVIAIIRRKNDTESKLVVSKELNDYSKEQIFALTQFQERFFDIEIISYDFLKKSIRNTVRGLIRKNDSILAVEGFNDKTNTFYYYLPGGGIEFREHSKDALKREIKEELDVEIKDIKQICTIENIFSYDDINNNKAILVAHEISFIYELTLPDVFYDKNEFLINDEVFISKTTWIDKNEFLSDKKKLYPEKLVDYL